MSTTSSGVVSDDFPAGLRVLVVDDDPTCLVIIERMLRSCKYEVTKCKQAAVALSLLRENKNGYDIVLSDVHMPDMDGFKLLEHIGLEMDLPVIMMSADDSKKVVMKGVTHGACDYLIKPVRIEALKTIWQHVFRKRKNDFKDAEQQGSVEDGDRNQKPSDEADYSSSANEGNWKNAKKRNNEEDENEERDDSSTLKKPRVVWSVDLHQQFVAAVNQLGIDKAVPKKILELMNVPGLTRENVASHLQKYRLYLRRLKGVSQGIASVPWSTTVNEIDLQAYLLQPTGQFSAPSAIPATMEPEPQPRPHGLGGQSSCLLMQMAHSQSGVQTLSDMNSGNIPQIGTSLSQPIKDSGTLIQIKDMEKQVPELNSEQKLSQGKSEATMNKLVQELENTKKKLAMMKKLCFVLLFVILVLVI